MHSSTILLATKNSDKIFEFEKYLIDIPISVKSMKDFATLPNVVEDQDTLKGNAIKKAKSFHNATGLLALADDTGLEVDALNGKPGVYSARYAGPNASYQDNVVKLLNELKDIPIEKRTARFRTVLAFVTPKEILTFDGVCEGSILFEQVGNKGFGYDPVFYYPPLQKTFSQLNINEKNKISHRGVALAQFRAYLLKLFGA